MSAKIDLESLFPHPESVARSMRAAAPQFMRCPEGHDLPHRSVWGRCSPLVCLAESDTPGVRLARENTNDSRSPIVPYRAEMDSLPRGMEGEAYERDVADPMEATRSTAQAEEALALMRTVGQKAARDALFPMPELPAAPSLSEVGPAQYIKQRLEQIAPLVLEMKIFESIYGTSAEKRMAAAEELLDRSGMAPRKNDGGGDMRGPVIILAGTQVANPYEAQKTLTRIDDGKPK